MINKPTRRAVSTGVRAVLRAAGVLDAVIRVSTTDGAHDDRGRATWSTDVDMIANSPTSVEAATAALSAAYPAATVRATPYANTMIVRVVQPQVDDDDRDADRAAAGQTHPTAADYRKTAAAVRNSPAGAAVLPVAAAGVHNLVADMLDAGVFGLALDWPDDLDAVLTRFDDALQHEAASSARGVLTADQRARIEEGTAKANAVVDEILDAEFGADGLARRTAVLVRTLARNVAKLPAPVVRELFKTSDALDEHRAAIKRQAAEDAVTAAHRVKRVGAIVLERLNPPYGRTFDALDAADLVTAVERHVGRTRAGELSDLDLHGEVASLLMPYADDDRRAKGVAGLIAVAAEVVSAVTADAAFYAYQSGLADGRARIAAEAQADRERRRGAELRGEDVVPLPVQLDPDAFAGAFDSDQEPVGPAGYFTVWSAAGERIGWHELYGRDFDEWAEVVSRPTLVVQGADYMVEPGTLLQVGVYTTDGGLIARRPVVAEHGPGTVAGRAELRYARPVTA